MLVTFSKGGSGGDLDVDAGGVVGRDECSGAVGGSLEYGGDGGCSVDVIGGDDGSNAGGKNALVAMVLV